LPVKDRIHVLRAYGKFMRRPTHLVQEIDQSLHAHTHSLTPQDISRILWSHARMRICPGQTLLTALQERALQSVSEFHSHHVASMLWAFGMMEVMPEERVLAALEDRARELITDNFTPRDLSNTLWAFAKLKVVPKNYEVMHALSDKVLCTVFIRQIKTSSTNL
jgi:hypothetical protein